MKSMILAFGGIIFSSVVFSQDAMQYNLKHLKILTEDQNVRVLRFAPERGDKTPMHSHPSSVVYVIKGGRVKYTMPDGSTTISELKAGDALLRPAVTHTDEAIDSVETVLVEMKDQRGEPHRLSQRNAPFRRWTHNEEIPSVYP